MNQEKSDLDLIKKTMQYYFDGVYHGDMESLEKVFHPEAHQYGFFFGDFMHLPAKDWFELLKKRPPPIKEGEEYDKKILSTDVTGPIASVKVEQLLFSLRYTEYLTLSKVDGNWLIVSSTFNHD